MSAAWGLPNAHCHLLGRSSISRHDARRCMHGASSRRLSLQPQHCSLSQQNSQVCTCVSRHWIAGSHAEEALLLSKAITVRLTVCTCRESEPAGLKKPGSAARPDALLPQIRCACKRGLKLSRQSSSSSLANGMSTFDSRTCCR